MNVASTKARLKNIADKNGKNFQDLLIAYGLERTIYRLSKSEYLDRFVLKGGIFLYAISGGDFARATVDIDLLAQNISNDIDDMRNVFRDIFSMQVDDALRYDLDTIEVISITEFKEYKHICYYDSVESVRQSRALEAKNFQGFYCAWRCNSAKQTKETVCLSRLSCISNRMVL